MISHSKHLMNSLNTNGCRCHDTQWADRTWKIKLTKNSCRTQAEVLQSSSKIWTSDWYSQSINTRHDWFQWSYSSAWKNSFYFCLEVPGIAPLNLPYSWDPLSPRHIPKGRPSAHRLHKPLSSLTHLSRAAKYMHQDIKSAEPSKHFCCKRRADNL